MIAVDGRKIEAKTFPDGTPNLLDVPIPHVGQKHIDITWCFDDMSELSALYMIASHYRDAYPKMSLILSMPYVPNARMDRTKSARECFTLKHMCRMLNSLEFDRIDVFDPHSDVTPALLDCVRVISADDAVRSALGILWDRPDVVFYPDAGAAKRYGEIIEGVPIAYGNKVRDWSTGEIIGYDVVGDADFDGKRVLIVDDITSYGGTFVHAAAALRAIGAASVDLYVSHAEKSCWKGKLFEDGGIGTLFTTDTLFEKDDLPEDLRNRVVFVKRFRDVNRGQGHPTKDEMREIASV